MAKISIQNVSKVFGPHPKQALELAAKGVSRADILRKTRTTVALFDISLDITDSELLVIMGLSGSGKSTLLRCLNGLIMPTTGRILVDGEDITTMNDQKLRRVRHRCFGMVFQNFALFPHRTVLQNTAFGLEVMGVSKADRLKKSEEMLERVGLAQWKNSSPGQLSGGMKQRVGLARALALEPEVLLMDEAFSALDPLIRQEMQDELLALQEDIQKTIVFITHDLNEAFKLGDRIVLLQDGTVVQTGTPENILQAPANDYVARFVASADASQVLTAASVMKRSEDVAVLGLDGPRAALRKMRAYSIASLFVLDRHRRFVGIINAADAKQMITEGRSDLTEITSTDIVTVSPDTPVTEIVPLMAELPYPLAVVDERQRLQGVIVRGLLLGSLVEHSKGGANAA
ncbi:MAG: glycine betaine/L-proline ABC transporter ATP-binding protein [Desulfovibrio sp.]|uniref:quaternary amine ABC transporter ATP-binding protein n=1 Tax=Desulfovibrio sp. TaxID=885 RepID=UPI0039E2DDB6